MAKKKKFNFDPETGEYFDEEFDDMIIINDSQFDEDEDWLEED